LNKLKAYKLQEGGLDTIDANLELGPSVDLREYSVEAQILADLAYPPSGCLPTTRRRSTVWPASGSPSSHRSPQVAGCLWIAGRASTRRMVNWRWRRTSLEAGQGCSLLYDPVGGRYRRRRASTLIGPAEPRKRLPWFVRWNQGRTSNTRLKGVSVARRKCSNPAVASSACQSPSGT